MFWSTNNQACGRQCSLLNVQMFDLMFRAQYSIKYSNVWPYVCLKLNVQLNVQMFDPMSRVQFSIKCSSVWKVSADGCLGQPTTSRCVWTTAPIKRWTRSIVLVCLMAQHSKFLQHINPHLWNQDPKLKPRP